MMKAQTTSKARSSSFTLQALPLARRVLLGLGALLLMALVVAVGPAVEAASVPIGVAAIDTVYRSDGAVCYVLDTGASAVVVVDPVAQVPMGTFTLPVAPGVARDIDYHPASGEVQVGCSNGMIFSVNTTTGAVTTLINNVGANYSIITAEDTNPAVLSWGLDVTGAWLDQIPLPGVLNPIGPVGLTTSVEMVAQAPSGTPFDGYLVTAGMNAGGQAQAWCFDRTLMTAVGTATFMGPNAAMTGVTTLPTATAYFSANDALTGNGYLLGLDLSTFTFAPAPLWSGTTPAHDIAGGGRYLGILGSYSGTTVDLFDMGGGTALRMGYLALSPGTGIPSGLSSYFPVDRSVYEGTFSSADAIQTMGTIQVADEFEN